MSTQITFVNSFELDDGTPADRAGIYERVPDAAAPTGYRRAHVIDARYNDGVVVTTQENAVFIVHVGSCRHLVRATATPSRFIIEN